MHELRQELRLDTPKGKGTVLFVHDEGREAPLYFTCICEGGEIWTFAQQDVRVEANITAGREGVKRK